MLGVDERRLGERDLSYVQIADEGPARELGEGGQALLVGAGIGPLVAAFLAGERAPGGRARADADLGDVAACRELADRDIERAPGLGEGHLDVDGLRARVRGRDVDHDGAVDPGQGRDTQDEGLVRHAAPLERHLRGLEPGIAHQPTEHAVPERAVTTTRHLRGDLAEAEPVHAVDGDRDRASIAGVAEREQGHRLAVLRAADGVLPQHQRARLRAADDVRAGHGGQLVAEQRTQRREHRRGSTDRGGARDDVGEIGRRLARHLAELDGQHPLEGGAVVAATEEGVGTAHHHEAPAGLDVLREVGQVPVQSVRDRVEILQNDGVEAGQVLGEELFDRELDQRELAVGGDHIVVVGAKNEEGDGVDRRVRLEPGAERPDIVGRPAGDVQDAHALAGDVEREEASVVVGDLIVARRLELDLDEAGASPVEGDGELHGRGAALDVRDARGEQRRRCAIE